MGVLLRHCLPTLSKPFTRDAFQRHCCISKLSLNDAFAILAENSDM